MILKSIKLIKKIYKLIWIFILIKKIKNYNDKISKKPLVNIERSNSFTTWNPNIIVN